MLTDNLVKVNITIPDAFSVEFLASELNSFKGKIYSEKNLEKNGSELAYITFYPEENKIILRVGVIYFMFKYVSGDKNRFFGKYEIEYSGKPGIVTLDEYKKEEEN